MSDLSFGWRYQPFEKLGPDLWGKRTESFFSLQRIMQALEPQFIHGIVRLLKRKTQAVASIPVLTVYSCPRILEEEHEISITRTLVQKVPIFLSRYGG